jgi:hypothetical protein
VFVFATRTRRPHPFFAAYLLALAVGVAAAVIAPGRAPAISLYWEPLYRAQVGALVMALVYVLAVGGWMAWNGRAFRRLEVVGAAIERDAEALDAAANEIGAFTDGATARLDALEEAVERLSARVDERDAAR